MVPCTALLLIILGTLNGIHLLDASRSMGKILNRNPCFCRSYICVRAGAMSRNSCYDTAKNMDLMILLKDPTCYGLRERWRPKTRSSHADYVQLRQSAAS